MLAILPIARARWQHTCRVDAACTASASSCTLGGPSRSSDHTYRSGAGAPLLLLPLPSPVTLVALADTVGRAPTPRNGLLRSAHGSDGDGPERASAGAAAAGLPDNVPQQTAGSGTCAWPGHEGRQGHCQLSTLRCLHRLCSFEAALMQHGSGAGCAAVSDPDGSLRLRNHRHSPPLQRGPAAARRMRPSLGLAADKALRKDQQVQ